MTDELVAFVRARLAEDEADALAASPGPWRVTAEEDEVLAVDGERVTDGFALSGRQLRATTRHIARHDPARILRDVAARRRIVDNYVKVCDYGHSGYTTRNEAYVLAEGALATTVKILATVYADHPDYQEAWKPAE